MAVAVPSGFPVVNPGWADFHRCSDRFGTEINPSDCFSAASSLPHGWDQTPYYTGRGVVSEEFTLPWSKTVGEQLMSALKKYREEH